MFIHIYESDFEREFLRSYDEKVKWFNDELKIQPREGIMSVKEHFSEVNMK